MISRRRFLQVLPTSATISGAFPGLVAADSLPWISKEQAAQWFHRWESGILTDERNRYCDKEMGEELGWLVSPFLSGFYEAYRYTGESKWVERFIDWSNACLKRAVAGPDGFPGWPKGDGGGGDSDAYAADSLLGEAMLLRPMVLMAESLRDSATVSAAWKAESVRYLEFAERIFFKWDSRSCWREVTQGGVWVLPSFGTDKKTGGWSAGYANRSVAGFSFPANKQNNIARWLATLFDVTGKDIYRDRSRKWFGIMKSRMRTQGSGGSYAVWNYWDPAGPWDYKPDGTTKLWVGVHPNGLYYGIDLEGIVTAFEHGWVFTRKDIDRLIATNRDFMWNQQTAGTKFRSIDGGAGDPRWKNTPGVLWTALLPYDATLRSIFSANHVPDSWLGLAVTPWSLNRRNDTGA